MNSVMNSIKNLSNMVTNSIIPVSDNISGNINLVNNK
jgi:hypothetical protein